MASIFHLVLLAARSCWLGSGPRLIRHTASFPARSSSSKLNLIPILQHPSPPQPPQPLRMPGPHAETSACAADCVAVHLQHGESKGTMFETTLPLSGTVSTYVACPPGETLDSMKEKKGTKVLLFACDVYGPLFINNQLLMDWHASNGTSPHKRQKGRDPEPRFTAQVTSSSRPTTSTANNSTTSGPTRGSPSRTGSASSKRPSRTPRGTRWRGRLCC